MLEYRIKSEKRYGLLKVTLELMKICLIEELKIRNISEYSDSLELGILLNFNIEFYETFLESGTWVINKSKFRINLFDGIIGGNLTITYDDIMIDDKLKEGIKKFLDDYFEECKGISGSMLGPRYDYYRRQGGILDETTKR